jgi:formylglycine-generating enzyme required for sulfatase activity
MDGLTYVWIPSGTFRMGCSPDDSECFDNERPAHTVTLTRGFWIGQTAVTQAAYSKVMDGNPSTYHGAQLPVEEVAWDNAKVYCERIKMRLPTEAEWEYAARGGAEGARYAAVEHIAWYNANAASATHVVAQKQPNAFGVYDMLGNVREWVADWYGPYAAADAADPQGPRIGRFRVGPRRLLVRQRTDCPRFEPRHQRRRLRSRLPRFPVRRQLNRFFNQVDRRPDSLWASRVVTVCHDGYN